MYIKHALHVYLFAQVFIEKMNSQMNNEKKGSIKGVIYLKVEAVWVLPMQYNRNIEVQSIP